MRSITFVSQDEGSTLFSDATALETTVFYGLKKIINLGLCGITSFPVSLDRVACLDWLSKFPFHETLDNLFDRNTTFLCHLDKPYFDVNRKIVQCQRGGILFHIRCDLRCTHVADNRHVEGIFDFCVCRGFALFAFSGKEGLRLCIRQEIRAMANHQGSFAPVYPFW